MSLLKITRLPPAPQSGEVDFREKADAFFKALCTFGDEVNAIREKFNDLVDEFNEPSIGLIAKTTKLKSDVSTLITEAERLENSINDLNNSLPTIIQKSKEDVQDYIDNSVLDLRATAQGISSGFLRNITRLLDQAIQELDNKKIEALEKIAGKFNSYVKEIQVIQNELSALVVTNVLYMQDSVEFVENRKQEIEDFIDKAEEKEETLQNIQQEIEDLKEETITSSFANAYIAEEIKEDFIDKAEEKEETLQNIQQEIEEQITEEFAIAYTLAESEKDLKEAIVNSDFTKSVSNQIFEIENDGDNEFIIAGGYVEGNLLVSFNGLLLDSDDYSANDGVKVKLNTNDTSVGDVVTVYVFAPFRVVNTYTKSEINAMFEVKEW